MKSTCLERDIALLYAKIVETYNTQIQELDLALREEIANRKKVEEDLNKLYKDYYEAIDALQEYEGLKQKIKDFDFIYRCYQKNTKELERLKKEVKE